MKKLISTKLLMLGLICLPMLAASVLHTVPADALTLPPSNVASATNPCENSSFFGLEPWYHFMPNSEFGAGGNQCAIHCFNFFVQNQPNSCGEKGSDVPGVILAIVDDLLRVGAIVAVIFVIIGSFELVGTRGNSEKASSAQSTIINALIGLAVTLVAVAFVSFIGNQLGG